jgi:transposase InsO family protein
LHQQLAVYKRTVTRPKLRTPDRLFWVGLARVWPGWRQALVIVSPDTVLRWQRRRFREYWTQLSRRPTGGRPCVNAEIASIVRTMAAANAVWTAQQVVDAFPDESAPAYLRRDRDRVYGQRFRHRVKGMGIEEVLTAPHSPWQNPFVERLIGSIRRECLDHVLVLDERHLRRILTRYFAYYHRARTHLALDKDASDLRPIELPAAGHIVQLPEVGGLHHRYVRQAA